MHRAVLTTGCSARAFPVLLWLASHELKGESAAQSSASTWNCLLGAIYAPELLDNEADAELVLKPHLDTLLPVVCCFSLKPKGSSEGTLSTSAAQESLSLPLHLEIHLRRRVVALKAAHRAMSL